MHWCYSESETTAREQSWKRLSHFGFSLGIKHERRTWSSTNKINEFENVLQSCPRTVRKGCCVCVLPSYTWVSPATAATARHSRQVSGETKLGHFHLPGKLVDHDIPQSQVTVNNLHREPTTLMQNVNTTIKSVFKLSKTKVTLGQSGTSIFPISLLCSYHFGAQVLHG